MSVYFLVGSPNSSGTAAGVCSVLPTGLSEVGCLNFFCIVCGISVPVSKAIKGAPYRLRGLRVPEGSGQGVREAIAGL
jgi:hypothetical protein